MFDNKYFVNKIKLLFCVILSLTLQYQQNLFEWQLHWDLMNVNDQIYFYVWWFNRTLSIYNVNFYEHIYFPLLIEKKGAHVRCFVWIMKILYAVYFLNLEFCNMLKLLKIISRHSWVKVSYRPPCLDLDQAYFKILHL